jgi:2-phospho-L-lactate guanylyltransferase
MMPASAPGSRYVHCGRASSVPAFVPSTVNWTIVVPLKALPAAKSRLQDASPDPQAHAALVDAIRTDTLTVAATAGRILLALDQEPAPVARPASAGPEGARIVQRRPGLNAALTEAAAYAQARWPADGIVALVGDLPAMRPDELRSALELAAGHQRGFVKDASGTGTTVLTALPGVELRPRFGPSSADRHAVIATSLAAGPGLRLDVDTAADLTAARKLGLGPATTAVLDRYGAQQIDRRNLDASSPEPGMIEQ